MGTIANPHLREFTGLYARNPIVLYVGAGISAAARLDEDEEDEQGGYGLPGWQGLLELLAAKLPGAGGGRLPDDPWAAADELAGRCGGDEASIQEALEEIVRNPANSRTSGAKGYKLLTREYVERAHTLRAVASFCVVPSGKAAGNASYRFRPNRRVRAVISGNYDHYLEACATSMFRRELLKPVGAIGSPAGRLGQTPVFHIHGYVPHEGQRTRIAYRNLAGGLVLTRDSYLKAWRADSAYCPTMGIQAHLLRHYVALFVGFSFADGMINQLLERIREDWTELSGRERWHYAVMRRDDARERTEARLGSLGVRPLWVEDYTEVPALLGRIYLAGLHKDHPGGSVSLPRYERGRPEPLPERHGLPVDDVWPLLLDCRIASPRRR